MYMYVFMYVCMYVCMYACMHACMYVYIYIYIIYKNQATRKQPQSYNFRFLDPKLRTPVLHPNPYSSLKKVGHRIKDN